MPLSTRLTGKRLRNILLIFLLTYTAFFAVQFFTLNPFHVNNPEASHPDVLASATTDADVIDNVDIGVDDGDEIDLISSSGISSNVSSTVKAMANVVVGTIRSHKEIEESHDHDHDETDTPIEDEVVTKAIAAKQAVLEPPPKRGKALAAAAVSARQVGGKDKPGTAKQFAYSLNAMAKNAKPKQPRPQTKPNQPRTAAKRAVPPPLPHNTEPKLERPSPLCSQNPRPKAIRTFRLGSRHDFQNSVRSGLHVLGLCEHRKGEKYDFYWDKQFGNDEVYRYHDGGVKDNGSVSSLPGFRDIIGTKDSLARLHSSCLDRHDSDKELCSFSKRAFNIERNGHHLLIEGGVGPFQEYVLSLSNYDVKGNLITTNDNATNSNAVQHEGWTTPTRQTWPQLWIFKPQEGFLGSGIKILPINYNDVLTSAGVGKWSNKMFPDGKWTFQEYVRSPLTFKRRKFDLRVWALVTSLNPLRVYVLEHAMPKVSTLEYNPGLEDLVKICMHIKMPLGNSCKIKHTVQPYPKTTDGVQFESYLDLPQNEQFLKEQHFNKSSYQRGWMGKPGEEPANSEPAKFHGLKLKDVSWKKDIWPQILDQMTITILSGLQMIKKQEKTALGADINRYNRFVFLSPDYAIDANGKVWIEEVNTNGFMVGDRYDSFFQTQAETVQGMQMLGANGYPERWKYETSLKNTISKFCEWLKKEGRGVCHENGKAALERMVDEEMHAGSWERAFPPKENDYPGTDKIHDFWELYSSHFIDSRHSKQFDNDVEISSKPGKLDLLVWEFSSYRVWRASLGDGDVLGCCVYCKRPKKKADKEKAKTGKGEEKDEHLDHSVLQGESDSDTLKRPLSSINRPWYFRPSHKQKRTTNSNTKLSTTTTEATDKNNGVGEGEDEDEHLVAHRKVYKDAVSEGKFVHANVDQMSPRDADFMRNSAVKQEGNFAKSEAEAVVVKGSEKEKEKGGNGGKGGGPTVTVTVVAKTKSEAAGDKKKVGGVGGDFKPARPTVDAKSEVARIETVGGEGKPAGPTVVLKAENVTGVDVEGV